MGQPRFYTRSGPVNYREQPNALHRYKAPSVAYDYRWPEEIQPMDDQKPLAAGWMICGAATGVIFVVAMVLAAIDLAPDIWHGLSWLAGVL